MPTEAVNVLLALTAFAVIHSLTAAPASKRAARALLGERAYHGLYRLLYNVFSAITFLPVLAVIAARPGDVVWRADGIAAALLTLVQIASLIGAIVAGLQVDVWRFAGLRQAAAYFSGDSLPLPPEPFVQSGMYGLVRHPLYLFSTLYLWTFPTMHAAQLAFAAGAMLYFAIGALFEERRLLREFGTVYAHYRCRVPFLVPFTGFMTRCAETHDLAPER